MKCAFIMRFRLIIETSKSLCVWPADLLKVFNISFQSWAHLYFRECGSILLRDTDPGGILYPEEGSFLVAWLWLGIYGSTKFLKWEGVIPFSVLCTNIMLLVVIISLSLRILSSLNMGLDGASTGENVIRRTAFFWELWFGLSVRESVPRPDTHKTNVNGIVNNKFVWAFYLGGNV